MMSLWTVVSATRHQVPKFARLWVWSPALKLGWIPEIWEIKGNSHRGLARGDDCRALGLTLCEISHAGREPEGGRL